MTATVSPDNATNKAVTYASSNASVASVDQSGNVSARAQGSATITVTSADNPAAKATVAFTIQANRIAVTSVTAKASKTALNIGETATITTTVVPANATDKTVRYASSNTSVIAVDASGKVTAKAKGSANVTVTSADNANAKATIAFTVAGTPIAQGTSGTCNWVIDADGNLVISPQSGNTGVLDEWDCNPWCYYNYDDETGEYGENDIKSVSFKGTVKAPTCQSMFNGLSNATSINLAGLDTSEATDISYMFKDCSSLTSLNLSGLDTSNVEYMYNMFEGCSSLASLNLTGLDTSSVTIMSSMFKGCSSLSSLDLSSFDFANVRSIENAFANCVKLQSINRTEIAISPDNYATEGMFYRCPLEGEVKVVDTNGDEVESGSVSVDSVSVGEESDLALRPGQSKWVYISVEPWGATNQIVLCENSNPSVVSAICEREESDICFIEAIKEGQATLTFRSDDNPDATCTVNVIVSNTTEGVCGTCKWVIDPNGKLTISPANGSSGELEEWGYVGEESSAPPWALYQQFVTSIKIDSGVKAKTCGALFGNAFDSYTPFYEGVSSIDLSGLDTSEVTNMAYMFAGFASSAPLDLSGLDTSNVTDMNCMFAYYSSPNPLDLSGLNTSNVTDTSYMFSGAEVQSINLSGLDLTSVTNMERMFEGCESLESIGTTELIVANGCNAKLAFDGCPLEEDVIIKDVDGTVISTRIPITGLKATHYYDSSIGDTLPIENGTITVGAHESFEIQVSAEPSDVTFDEWDDLVYEISDYEIIDWDGMDRLIYGVQPGEATVTISVKDNPDISVTVKVIVEEAQD